MTNRYYRFLPLALALIGLGAACGVKTTVSVANTNVSVNVNVPVNAVVEPSGTTTGDFSTSTNTTAPASVVTITKNGVSPKSVTVKAGTAVSFVNNDTVVHHIASNPHPTHTDVPGFDDVATSAPGGTYTFVFTTKGTFGYHDHENPNASAFHGTVVVQ